MAPSAGMPEGTENQLLPVKLDLESNPFPDLEAMHAHWQRLRGNRFAPSRADFDPVEVEPHLLPRILMIDVTGAPPEFTYRHWGTGIVDLHGRDMTGRPVTELNPKAFADLSYRQYMEVVETRAPGLYVHQVPGGAGRWYPHAILRLPFSSDGQGVDLVLSVDEYGADKELMKPYFRTGTLPNVGAAHPTLAR